MRRAFTGMAAVAALTVYFPAAASAATTSTPTTSTAITTHGSSVPSWTIQPVPLPPGATNAYLPAVSCPSAASCTAVGSRFETWTNRPWRVTEGELAEHWNGSTWTTQATSRPADEGATGTLSGVSCTSAASCTAVGDYQNRSGNYLTLAEHWNGRSWAIQATPTPPAVAFVSLKGVWCTSAASCTAVGYYATGLTSGPGATLVEYWNGSTWTIQPTPNPSGAEVSILTGVWCASAASCTAVGYSVGTSQASLTLAERWNGSIWTIQPTPRPSGSTSSALSGVSCTTTASCTAVGGAIESPNTRLTLAEHWNGSTWTIQPTPTPSGPIDDSTGLHAVSCTSVNRCTAVGEFGKGALAERWNGTKWEQQHTTSPASHKLLYAVSCTSSRTCTAVGGTPGNIYRSDQPLAEHE